MTQPKCETCIYFQRAVSRKTGINENYGTCLNDANKVFFGAPEDVGSAPNMYSMKWPYDFCGEHTKKEPAHD